MYNRATLVSETLDSVFAQTYTDWECIVVDDGSTDNSVDVVQKYVDKDSRFKLLIRPDDRIKGAPTCRNIGFENSTGEYVIFFDSDDILDQSYFKTVILSTQHNPTLDFFVVPYNRIIFKNGQKHVSLSTSFDPANGTLFEQIFSQRYLLRTFCLVWQRHFLERKSMLWREGLAIGQDYDFNYRMIIDADKGMWIDSHPLCSARIHSQNMHCGQTDPHLGEIQINNFIIIFHLLVDSGKCTLKIRNLFLWFFIRHAMLYTVVFGSRKGALSAYYFVRQNCHGVKYARVFTLIIYLNYLLYPITFSLGKIIIYYRENIIFRELRNFLDRIINFIHTKKRRNIV
jgi:glycosyltransferase involved in cell wall biosynthesis